MSLFKCKMCGGTIEFNPGASVGVCDSCGTKQTLPRLDDDRRANLYDRANHFRRNNEFDKATAIYEQILNEDTTDAEAYWSLVLSQYGIEYVEDPATHQRVPTVNRAQFTSIFDDDNYKSALQYADIYQRDLYEQEAKTINEIQKGILAISQKEEPFDVFICYKETDNNGRRTPDSVLANDLYHQLVNEGFKVFFARITLEDKLGTAYEPYIFAALNSAKVMVVLGTKPEHFNAVWVKNEWSRYLSLVKQSGGMKMLIPAYKDMDPYDLPEEFSHLQAQDMSKLGFMQDIIRGIKKITKPESTNSHSQKDFYPTPQVNITIAPILKRGFLFLADGEWSKATDYFEKVLDADPENSRAYVGRLLSELHIIKEEQLVDSPEIFSDKDNYKKALQFADDTYRKKLIEYSTENIYRKAKKAFSSARTENDYKEANLAFVSIKGYKDADILSDKCQEKAEEARIEEIYKNGRTELDKDTIPCCESAVSLLKTIPEYKDSQELIEKAENRIAELTKEKKKLRKNRIIVLSIFSLLVIALTTWWCIAKNASNKTRAEVIYNNFIGKTFSYTDTYNSNYNSYTFGFKSVSKTIFSFNSNGSVSYDYTYQTFYNDYWKEYDRTKRDTTASSSATFDSYTVTISLFGKVYVSLIENGKNPSQYTVNVDENDVPISLIGGGDRVYK